VLDSAHGTYLRLSGDLTDVARELVDKLGDEQAAELAEMVRRITAHRPILSVYAQLLKALRERDQ
jgi:hypothetical protein